MSFWAREIAEGDDFPRWFGLAWRHPHRLTAVLMPVPLNLIAGIGRRLWFAILHGVYWHRLDAAEARLNWFILERERLLCEIRELRLWKQTRLEDDASGAIKFRAMIERIQGKEPS